MHKNAEYSGKRADFTPQTRNLLARRAAYRCSNPDCLALTIGPGAGTDDISETGVAAHIFAASADGPRGDGSLTFGQRQEQANGVWLCHRCSRLVDNNDGNAFPPSVLRGWRDLHEARTRIEHSGYARPFGWVQNIELSDNRWTDGVQHLHLSRCNLVVGGIGSGKSCLLALLTGLSHPHELMQRVAPDHRISARVRWFDPQPREAHIVVAEGNLSYEVDGKLTPFAARPYRSIVVTERGLPRQGDIAGVARALGVEPWTLTAALPQLGKVGGRVAEAHTENGLIALRMHDWTRTRRWGSDFPRDDAVCTIHELAIAIADLQADVEPTLLVFDGGLGQADSRTAGQLLHIMCAANRSFQSVVLGDLRLAGTLDSGRLLDGWSHTWLSQTSAGTRLRSVR